MALASRGEESSSTSVSPKSPPSASAQIHGYVAGVASGLTKLSVGHPFDSIKVRMQISPLGTYKGPLDCFLQLVQRESLLGLYKGASPPAIGWAVSDSILLGTLHNLRLVFSKWTGTAGETGKSLPIQYHALAGLGAGWTNSLITTPTENLKTLLQMQTQRVSINFPGSAKQVPIAGTQPVRQFTGPIDAAKQIINHHGALGLWRTLPATLAFRSSFAVMFGSFEFFNKQFTKLKGTSYEVSTGTATFLSGGLAAECFWLTALPADNVKNLMMSDIPGKIQYPSLRSAIAHVWNRAGKDVSVWRKSRNFYAGFIPAAIRSFPTNAAALFVYEGVMEFMGAERTVSK
ncbi:unnamed protein product [Sympodiomycopsis kandeliae]